MQPEDFDPLTYKEFARNKTIRLCFGLVTELGSRGFCTASSNGSPEKRTKKVLIRPHGASNLGSAGWEQGL